MLSLLKNYRENYNAEFLRHGLIIMNSHKKILVIGSDGFIGANVQAILSGSFDVYGAVMKGADGKRTHQIDLLDRRTIARVFLAVQPNIVINNAGIVDKGEKAQLNLVFTTNLLETVAASGLKPERIILSGSAAEYGIVEKLPVSEDTPVRATSDYGLSKLQETSFALAFASKHSLPVVIGRIFNPIGPNMNPGLMVPKIIEQVREVKQGRRKSIEISRLDSQRDYIHVKDIARAFRALVEGQPKRTVYNLGSGKSTTNQALVELILDNSKLVDRPAIVQTADIQEPLYASQADITRMHEEFGWLPRYTIQETIKELIDAER